MSMKPISIPFTGAKSSACNAAAGSVSVGITPCLTSTSASSGAVMRLSGKKNSSSVNHVRGLRPPRVNEPFGDESGVASTSRVMLASAGCHSLSKPYRSSAAAQASSMSAQEAEAKSSVSKIECIRMPAPAPFGKAKMERSASGSRMDAAGSAGALSSRSGSSKATCLWRLSVVKLAIRQSVSRIFLN